jgi:hypothetical protein
MLKNIVFLIFVFQLSMVIRAQMDLFNNTYDFHSDLVPNAWLNMLVRNDTLILIGTSSHPTFNRLEVGSTCLSGGSNMVVNSIWNPIYEGYYSGIGSNLWSDPLTSNLFITGPIVSNAFFAKGFIARTNISGDSIKVFNTVLDTTDIQSSYYNPIEGSIVLAGIKAGNNGKTDIWLTKYDTSGTLLWENTFGGAASEVSFSLDRAHDGGYVIGGFTYSYGSGLRDVYVVKTDSMGVFEWQRVFGDIHNDVGFVKALENGDILVYGGTSKLSSGEGDAFVKKLDSLGSEKWHNEYGYGLNVNEIFQAMAISSTGYLFAGASTDANDNNPLGWLLKTDFDGNELWSRRFRKRDNDNYFRDVLELPNGDIMACGFVFSEGNLSQDAWLVRTNCLGFDTLPEANGEVVVLAEKKVRLQNMSKAWGNCIIDWGDGTSNYLYEDYSTYIEHIYPNTQARTIKITAIACGVEDTISFTVVPTMVNVTKETLDSFSLYPNPTSDKVTLQIPAFQEGDYSVSFYNNLGKRVAISPISTGKGYEINTSEISRGMYQVVLVHRNGVRSVKKLVVH